MTQLYRDGRIFPSINDLLDFLRFGSRRVGERVFAYRGQANEDYQLTPRLYRTPSQGSGPAALRSQFVHNRFTTWQFLSDLLKLKQPSVEIGLAYLQLLAVAQHYPEFPGACGTELLDFSWSYDVAASFASRPGTGVGVIYKIHAGELRDLMLGDLIEIELPSHFIRPLRQEAVFLRGAPHADLPGHLDKFYFRQSEPNVVPNCQPLPALLESGDDEILQFARRWVPSPPPPQFETHILPLLEREYVLLSLAQRPQHTRWHWLDAFCAALFDVYRGEYMKAWRSLSGIQYEMVRESLGWGEESEAVMVMINMTGAECMADLGYKGAAVDLLRAVLDQTKFAGNQAVVRGLLNQMN